MGDAEEYGPVLQRALGAGYEVRGLLGSGGFGVVFVAWDRRLEREVAVKVLRHEMLATPTMRERFWREARILAQLRHPNIVPVFDVGEAEGVVYLTMPRVVGESLRDLLGRERRLGVTRTVGLVAEVGRALDAAHRAGVIHRDVKPENVLLEGKEQRALLTDFGIARTAALDGPAVTAAGLVMGSPQYMSPEQMRGDADIGFATDLYALGAMAFEMLAGTLPYAAATVQQLIYLQVTTDPAPLGDLRPDVPKGVSEAVTRCLRREPGDRWASVDEFVRALLRASPLSVFRWL
jgi:serine/threonine-protein kinase